MSKKKKKKSDGVQRSKTHPHNRMNHKLRDVLHLSIGVFLEIKLGDCSLSSRGCQAMTPTYGRPIISSLYHSYLFIRDLDDRRSLKDWQRSWDDRYFLQKKARKDRRLPLICFLSLQTSRHHRPPFFHQALLFVFVYLHGGQS
jgi:hypothetical protein